ncbi:hypothetical protein ADIARSV_4217 [Arcticibacter svalbardensis MN12-7]|uniref:Uncharacterized protein n=1 Tax=Arcticibacter svalbardensis MN12-7 TaxID=1150600 RepID=R9GMG5_9SPHI|nr:hypothetical protein [Arcticibacter svalbardensis]EOR92705.1 hypothetical protein ADIARSV_4217 [Arcticibacter svalbardensis MN12-7]
MKGIMLYLGMLIPLFAISQTEQKVKYIEIKKLVIDKRKSYDFSSRDSSVSIKIDTLIMHANARINFLNKKEASMVVGYAQIDNGAQLNGNDGKNNGTNLNLSINFADLKSLSINVPGLDAKTANRKFDNGNGGKIVVKYLSSGIKPQTENSKQPAFLDIRNSAGGYTTNAQTDLVVVFSQIRSGNPGRPLSQLPNGRVYSGNTGGEGKFTMTPVADLED